MIAGPASRSTVEHPGWVREVTDTDIDLCDLHSTNPDRYPALLESVVNGTNQSRYSILFAFPGECIAAQRADAGFLNRLDNAWRHTALTGTPPPLPFSGGWLLYLGYELAGEIEPGIAPRAGSAGILTAQALRIPAAIVRDHARNRTWLVSEVDDPQRIELMRTDLANPPTRVAALPDQVEWIEEPPEGFLDGVDRIKQYIRDGDVFQVNLSRQWQAVGRFDPAALYRSLRRSNPAPFAGIWRLDARHCIVSSSPERLVEVRGRRVSTRPIAGTYPRGDDAAADRRLAAALVDHPKERAEHVMLIDLERNDLGRICVAGSVEVEEFMVVESYRHVHHIVSQVSGELRDDVTPAQVIRAVFPGGTITGCPKVRCMQIIRELEQAPRGPYTGSMGYLNHDGSMDLNILIRTMLVEDDRVSVRAGSGIVADSVPERELAETRAKARGMLRALGRTDTGE